MTASSHDRRRTNSRPAYLGAALLSTLALLWLGACQDEGGCPPGTYTHSSGSCASPSFQDVKILGAVPAGRYSDGSWVPLCGSYTSIGSIANRWDNVADAVGGTEEAPTTPEGVLLQVSFLSTERGDGDQDTSLRPQDVVTGRRINGLDEDDIRLKGRVSELSCLEPVPDAQEPPSSSQCDGLILGSPPTEETSLLYKAHTPGRAAGHNILVLIDQSGSMTGIVDGETFKEGCCTIPPSDFGTISSDFERKRIKAVEAFLKDLNDDDNVGVIAFGEGVEAPDNMKVPCWSQSIIGNTPTDLDACFGNDIHNWISEGDGSLDLGAASAGRSNLWSAVDAAVAYLTGATVGASAQVSADEMIDHKRSRHVVVVTDGPDTCDPASETYADCQIAGTCGSADFTDALTRLASATVPVHVHFVQFESPGYRGRDPRQVEVACQTGGLYQFINSQDMTTSTYAFESALEQALLNVRYSLMGHWQLAHSISNLDNPASLGVGGVPPGSLYALSGTLEFSVNRGANTELLLGGSPLEVPLDIGLGQAGVAPIIDGWDRRPTITKPCQLPQECAFSDGSLGSEGPCQVICSPETHLCVNGGNGLAKPNLSSCQTPEGGYGSCCEGMCGPPGQSCSACE